METTGVLPSARVRAPILLGPNQPLARPYRGGAGIARFRGTAHLDEFTPEDFVGSTTEVHAGGGVGLSRLPDGTLLRDAIAHDPVGFLGDEHVRRFGADTLLLLKLLDTGERLFVHFHPDDAFARSQMSAPRGKTEAWIVIALAEGVDGHAHLGFNRPVSEVEVEHWFREQDVPDLLGAMNRVPLAVGDTLLVPAGTAHAIGAGITLVELQQPSDLSILLEYSGFPGLDAGSALLGLDERVALSGLDRRASDPERLGVLKESREIDDEGRQRLFPREAEAFFRAERLIVSGRCLLAAEFSLLVVEAGAGSLEWGDDALPLSAGTTVLIPHGAGEVAVTGDLRALRARGPAAD